MNTISLEKAKTIIEKHKSPDKTEDLAELYRQEVLSPTQSCAGLILQYARKKITKKFGAVITGKLTMQVSRDKESYAFEDIPPDVLETLCCGDNCHENCVNASLLGLPNNAIIHTSEISVLPEEKTGLAGLLHSYVQLGGEIFDLKLGIKMNKDNYDRLFNVKEISQLPVSKVQNDFKDKTLEQLSNHKPQISYEEYLMARDDCARLVGTGK